MDAEPRTEGPLTVAWETAEVSVRQFDINRPFDQSIVSTNTSDPRFQIFGQVCKVRSLFNYARDNGGPVPHAQAQVVRAMLDTCEVRLSELSPTEIYPRVRTLIANGDLPRAREATFDLAVELLRDLRPLPREISGIVRRPPLPSGRREIDYRRTGAWEQAALDLQGLAELGGEISLGSIGPRPSDSIGRWAWNTATASVYTLRQIDLTDSMPPGLMGH